MAGIDDSLDSEFDDPITSIPIVSKKSIRKKVIGLDDLLADFYHERSKCVEKEAKRVRKAPKKLVSDELDTKEASLSMLVDQCQTQMIEMGGDEENSHWGVQLFGDQRSSPSMAAPTLEKCDLLKSFMNNEVNSLIELSFENGETFTEGLLVSGWLTKLVLARGHVDESIAKRVSHLMFYSSKEELRTTACNFWCEILSTAKESMKIDWLPSYSDIRKALDVYGFVSLPGTGVSSANSSCRGPGQNIISWIRFATICGQVRDSWPVFSTSDAEELIEVIISVFLDRHLQGLSVLLYKCMQTLLNYLMDAEWVSSSKKIAKYLARSVPKDLNCIRIVECISGIDDRSKHLRSLVAYETLFALFDCKAVNDEILRLLLAINLKERSCDLFKAYIYLVLTENWLLSNKLIEEKPVLKEMWGLYLRQCNCMISSTDLRSFAPKIRDRASFLQQGAKRIQQGF